jgi:hypothetical protein
VAAEIRAAQRAGLEVDHHRVAGERVGVLEHVDAGAADHHQVRAGRDGEVIVALAADQQIVVFGEARAVIVQRIVAVAADQRAAPSCPIM